MWKQNNYPANLLLKYIAVSVISDLYNLCTLMLYNNTYFSTIKQKVELILYNWCSCLVAHCLNLAI